MTRTVLAIPAALLCTPLAGAGALVLGDASRETFGWIPILCILYGPLAGVLFALSYGAITAMISRGWVAASGPRLAVRGAALPVGLAFVLELLGEMAKSHGSLRTVLSW